jgi:hypothetical protein
MIRKTINIKDIAIIVETAPKHADMSVKETLSYWAEKILIRHFRFGNTIAYGYKRLSPAYARRKTKRFGKQPILVATGTLRDDAVGKYRVYRYANKWKVVLDIPEYGKYVKETRDFTLINKRDQRDLNRFWKSDMTKRRKRFVSRLR